jgi:DNA/RNA-binding domain of Phe-tRNA-synthetase-like protein
MQETAATVTLFRNQDTNMINTQAIPMSLWDKAYDSLKQEKPELMSKYEDLLSRVLIRGSLDYIEPVP